MSLPDITAELVAAVFQTMCRLAPDPMNKPRLMDYLSGPGPHSELRLVLRALARQRQPRTYLEIGVRRGWSLAQVAAECPQCDITAIDLWVPDYGGMTNPGPEFVAAQLQAAEPSYSGQVTFMSGDSADLLPQLAGKMFDLICVDGDHTTAGVSLDLALTLPKVAVGGALVMDDLLTWADGGGALLAVWRQMQIVPGFVWHEVAGLVPVGVAERT
jgi:hypothetical protein